MSNAYLRRARRALPACSLAVALFVGGCHGGRHAGPVASAEPRNAELTDVYLTDDKDNSISKTSFANDTKPIFLIFSADAVSGVPVRAVWIADQPGGGTREVLAEEEMVGNGSKLSGSFSDRPPQSGWKPGPYQVDIYFGETLVHSEHFKVVNKVAELDPTISQDDGTPAPGTDDGSSSASGMKAGGIPTSPSSPADHAGGSPQPTDVTPIPATPMPTMPPEPPLPQPPVAEDAQGRIILGVHDAFELHTAKNCHDVTYTVKVNGRRQGVYGLPDMTSDISLDFSPGPNTIRISWDAPSPERECQMAIALNRHHRTRTLTTVHVFRLSPPQGSVGLGVVVQ